MPVTFQHGAAPGPRPDNQTAAVRARPEEPPPPTPYVDHRATPGGVVVSGTGDWLVDVTVEEAGSRLGTAVLEGCDGEVVIVTGGATSTTVCGGGVSVTVTGGTDTGGAATSDVGLDVEVSGAVGDTGGTGRGHRIAAQNPAATPSGTRTTSSRQRRRRSARFTTPPPPGQTFLANTISLLS